MSTINGKSFGQHQSFVGMDLDEAQTLNQALQYQEGTEATLEENELVLTQSEETNEGTAITQTRLYFEEDRNGDGVAELTRISTTFERSGDTGLSRRETASSLIGSNNQIVFHQQRAETAARQEFIAVRTDEQGHVNALEQFVRAGDLSRRSFMETPAGSEQTQVTWNVEKHPNEAPTSEGDVAIPAFESGLSLQELVENPENIENVLEQAVQQGIQVQTEEE